MKSTNRFGRLISAAIMGLGLLLLPAAASAQVAAPASTVPAVVAAPSSPTTIEQGYRLGPGDVVEISVLGRADFNNRARIGQDGVISLPFLGSVPAADRTSNELAEEIRAGLEKGGYFAKPVVRVEIVGYASRYVTVLGAVGTPGLVPLDRPYRLSEILARVGGRQSTGADYLIVTKGDTPGKRYPIATLATGGAAEDPMVAAGDKIFIPTAESEIFYISGQVKAPGVYPLTSGLTFRMALARGGGVTPEGSDKKVIVHRGGAKGKKMPLDTKVEVGDVIVVGERMF